MNAADLKTIVTAGARGIGAAVEVTRMARFLFTEASYSTGSEFVVDGGAVTGQVLPLAGD